MDSSVIAFPIAFGGGIISFLSPCVLPLVPAYMSYITGRSIDDLMAEDGARNFSMAGPMIPATAFVLGFTTIFVILGASATAISRLLLSQLDVLSKIAGGMIVLFGLHYMGALRIPFLHRQLQLKIGRPGGGVVGAYVLGLAFAVGWTPCIGPVLGSILAVAASQADVTRGIALLTIYSLGLGIPFLGAAAGVGKFASVSGRIRPHLRKIEVGAGLLLVGTGVLIFSGIFTRLGFYLLEVFPWLINIG